MSNQKKNHSADLADALRSASAEFARKRKRKRFSGKKPNSSRTNQNIIPFMRL